MPRPTGCRPHFHRQASLRAVQGGKRPGQALGEVAAWVLGGTTTPNILADSIKSAAKIVAANLFTYYKGNEPGQTPGILPGPPPAGPYYWWEAGAMWGAYVDYWHYTNDTTYNNVTEYSLIFQAGPPQNSYMPPNWTASLGNDDQGFWGMSAMIAAEDNFENPPAKDPQWLALAQAVFNTQAARWDSQYCNGGLRWQIPLSNNGYDYKNTIANGIFFNLGARLARYTGNDTYAQWAKKTYDWCVGVGYIDKDYNIFDGGHVEHNCTDINQEQFSYTHAIFAQAAAFMYNYVSTACPLRMPFHTGRTVLTKKPDERVVRMGRGRHGTNQPNNQLILPRRNRRRARLRASNHEPVHNGHAVVQGLPAPLSGTGHPGSAHNQGPGHGGPEDLHRGGRQELHPRGRVRIQVDHGQLRRRYRRGSGDGRDGSPAQLARRRSRRQGATDEHHWRDEYRQLERRQ